jgi:hypothetical protein
MTFELHGSGKVGEVLGMGPAGHLVTGFTSAIVLYLNKNYVFYNFGNGWQSTNSLELGL